MKWTILFLENGTEDGAETLYTSTLHCINRYKAKNMFVKFGQ